MIVNEMIGDGISPGTVYAVNLLLLGGSVLKPGHSSELSIASDRLDFGARPMGDTELLTLTARVNNVTANPIPIAGVTIEGARLSAFSLHADSGKLSFKQAVRAPWSSAFIRAGWGRLGRRCGYIRSARIFRSGSS